MVPFLVCINCFALLLLKMPWPRYVSAQHRAGAVEISHGAHVAFVWIQTSSDDGLFL